MMTNLQEVPKLLQVIYNIIGESSVREASDTEIAEQLNDDLGVVQRKLEALGQQGYIQVDEERTFGSRYKIRFTELGRSVLGELR